MMTFYSAIGSYRIKNQNGRKVPYIQRLGKLHPISIPEFVIWSTLLWEVLTYDELKRFYDSQMKLLEGEKPDFDQLLDLLVKRKLVSKGLPALAAERSSRLMEMRTENTAPMPATSQTASEVVMAMNEDQFEREKLYQATMNMFRSMLKKGLITEEQYAIIDTKMLQKYQPLLGTLFAAQPL